MEIQQKNKLKSVALLRHSAALSSKGAFLSGAATVVYISPPSALRFSAAHASGAGTGVSARGALFFFFTTIEAIRGRSPGGPGSASAQCSAPDQARIARVRAPTTCHWVHRSVQL